MTPPPVGRTCDNERGLRLKDELGKIFPESSSDIAIAKAFLESTDLNMEPRTVTGWFQGRNIDNGALATLIALEVDVAYILTGIPCPRTVNSKDDAQSISPEKMYRLLKEQAQISEAQAAAIADSYEAMLESERWAQIARQGLFDALTQPEAMENAHKKLTASAKARQKSSKRA